MIIPSAVAVLVAPLYVLTSDFTLIVVGFVLQGLFGGAIYSQWRSLATSANASLLKRAPPQAPWRDLRRTRGTGPHPGFIV
jgi:hypothetical protein